MWGRQKRYDKLATAFGECATLRSSQGARAMGCFASRAAGGGADDWDGAVRDAEAWSVEPALTAEQLARLRAEFWETRVEGRTEMWQALRFAAEAESPELRSEAIKAAGLRPANKRGTLAAIYDERGALYELPVYVLRDPSNLGASPPCPAFKDAARAVAEYADRVRARSA